MFTPGLRWDCLYFSIVSCALIYDDAIRACAVSTVMADRTGKIVLLTYSLTASHCSTRFKVQGSLLFVTYTIIQDIIGSEMLVGTGPLNGKCKKEK